ncbi:MAG: hypothetical protein C0631_06120 [Sedimenticola sp.]|jgi:hypothetical protein|nr:MAG: hypothetical protein C0631_06120 [Sedimenticola sp.]
MSGSDDKPGQTPPDNLVLDDQGIPILDEIVLPDAEEDEEEEFDFKTSSQPLPQASTLGSFNLNLPNHNALIMAIRNQLRARLVREITPILEQVTEKVAAEVTADFAQRFNDELNQSLKRDIEAFIDETLEKEFNA